MKTKKKKINVSKQELEDLYLNQGLSTRDIAKIFDVCQTTIRRWLAKYDIATRTSIEGKQTKAYKEKSKQINKQISKTLTQYYKESGHILIQKCIVCGKEFEVIASKPKQTCSNECLKIYLNTTHPKHVAKLKSQVCKICGLPVNRGQKYCPECSKLRRQELAEQLKNRITVKCDNCGKEIERTPSTLHKHNYCSVECMAKHYSESEMFAGENSASWTGGKRHYTGNWTKQRNLARERDNYTCQLCGVTESEWHKQMDVHHIINYRYFEDKKEANQLDNLVCLCNLCHSFVHSNSNTDKKFIKDKI